MSGFGRHGGRYGGQRPPYGGRGGPDRGDALYPQHREGERRYYEQPSRFSHYRGDSRGQRGPRGGRGDCRRQAGRERGRGHANRPHPKEIEVEFNVFPMEFRQDMDLTVYLLRTEIRDVQKDTTCLLGDENSPVLDTRSSPRTIQIMNACRKLVKSQQLGWDFVSDGSMLAVSNKPLPEKEAKHVVTIDVNESHAGATKKRMKSFMVTFREVSQIKVEVRDNVVKMRNKQEAEQIINTVSERASYHIIEPAANNEHAQLLNSGVLQLRPLCFGKKSGRPYFLPLEQQTRSEVGFKTVTDWQRAGNTGSQPIVGERHSAYLNGEGRINCKLDVALEWVSKEKDDKGHRIPLLANKNSNVATLIDQLEIDPGKPIPAGQQKQVKDILEKTRFHALYACGPTWEAEYRRRVKEKTGSDHVPIEKLEKAKNKQQMELRMYDVRFEPQKFKFVFKDRTGNERLVTVQEYYRTVYDVVLKYPCMPLIRTSSREDGAHFPLELLYQCKLVLGSLRTRGSPDSAATHPYRGVNSDHTSSALTFNDEFAGSKRISKAIDIAANKLRINSVVESILSLMVQSQPKTTTAEGE